MRPLEDVRIIAIEQYGAGPFGSVHLADLGAEVIKIEDPSTAGDVGRSIPPYATEGDSLFFETLNRNKRSLALDLATPAGRQVFEDLVRVSDAVYSNLRGDVPHKLGITYSQLEHLNPAIVCCSLSGFGMTGPRAGQPGYDYMLQALAGWMSLTGEPDGPPTKSGTSLVDWAGGFVAALSLLAGLHAARRDGRGTDCDVSLYETALSMLGYLSTWQLNTDYVPQRTRHSAHPSMVPFQAFQAVDGWLVVACPKEKFWQRLTGAIDRAELAADERFGSIAARHAHAGVLTAILDEVFAQRSVREWLDVLSEASVPCAPVQDVATALSDEHNAARGLIVSADHPRYGQVKMTASPVRVGQPCTEYRRAPRLGEDRDYVLGQVLHYSPEQVQSAAGSAAFGTPPANRWRTCREHE
ncbi:MAG TPA: CoA transferase [Streptosporangiaceae bacterium]|nr:CoA transferase [Streptosporangiaceae bacterium]